MRKVSNVAIMRRYLGNIGEEYILFCCRIFQTETFFWLLLLLDFFDGTAAAAAACHGHGYLEYHYLN